MSLSGRVTLDVLVETEKMLFLADFEELVALDPRNRNEEGRQLDVEELPLNNCLCPVLLPGPEASTSVLGSCIGCRSDKGSA